MQLARVVKIQDMSFKGPDLLGYLQLSIVENMLSYQTTKPQIVEATYASLHYFRSPNRTSSFPPNIVAC
jgi:hypothetical protein